MSAIFISYTGRDGAGDAWADRLEEWFGEWNYGFFRDKHHSHGVKAGDDWRATLYRELGLATVMVSLCTKQYDSSPWCVGEVAIAVEKGTTVIPIQLVDTAEELRTAPLPLLLQTDQAIQVAGAADPSPTTLEDVKRRLARSLREALKWRDLLDWDPAEKPFPGLPAFEAQQAPVFFGRDGAIEEVHGRLKSLALRPPGFLLLLGASGYGKSSLVRAGVVPRLRAGGDRSWFVLRPFTPGGAPFAALQGALRAAGGDGDGVDPLRELQRLRSVHQAPVLLVIDQFEELLTAGATQDDQPGEQERFLAFLQQLLSSRTTGVVVLATMRTDYLAPLQRAWPRLTSLATTETLEPIAPEDFGQLIRGPADRAALTLQPGLEERLVNESGGRDALPLLAFTLEQLWKKRQERGGPAAGPRGERWDLTLADYQALGGVDGSVSTRARECWDPALSSAEEAGALRDAFLEHLVSVNDDGVAKRPARLEELPPASQEIVHRMVDDRLLVLANGTVEIAHEALLRTWEPLKGWIEEGKEELLQRLRVKRLTADLAATAVPRQRRQALDQLAALAAAGGSEQKAVGKEGAQELARLLADGSCNEGERLDAALILALIGAEQPLLACLADGAAPPQVRRRAAESLGLLAQRSGDPEQRGRIERELEAVLRGAPLDVRIEVELDLEQLDPAMLQELEEQVQRQVVEDLQQAIQNGQLQGLSEEQLRSLFQQAVQQQLQEKLKGLQSELWASGAAPGWKDHDERLPLLQGAARGLQLAASAALPLLGSGPGRVVPLLTLTALEEGGGLHITTEVVEVPVWRLPLPGGEQLELVMVPGGTYTIGSPAEEAGRDRYTQVFMYCKGVEVEARREVRLAAFALVRQPISQAQWRSVVEAASEQDRGQLKANPGTPKEPANAWERHGQPEALPVNQVSWNDCRRWLACLNGWWQREWDGLGGQGEAPQLALPSESQWEAASRAGADTPFHFGATLDASWARYDASYCYGKGRRGAYEERQAPIGFSGLVNHWGLADLHGQVAEWCADQWQRDPAARLQGDGRAVEGPDPELADVPRERDNRLLRGGSCISSPHGCRAAFRDSYDPDYDNSNIGLRPCCCPSPPGSLLGS